jgi:phosphotransferase system enzyme I (PtsI)
LPAQIVSPGKACGILCFVNVEKRKSFVATKIPETEVVNEIKRFENTTHLVAKEIKSAAEALKKDNSLEESEILETHIAMLQDKHFLKKVGERIKNNRIAADVALEYVLQEITTMFEQSADAYISERAADFKDVAGRLIRKLHRKDMQVFQTIIGTIKNPIIAIPELLPSHLLEVRNSGVAGFVVAKGTSLVFLCH